MTRCSRRYRSSVRRVVSILPLLCAVLNAFPLVPSIHNNPIIRSLVSTSRLSSAINNVEWGRKTVLQLQKELRSRGLSDKGTKTDLIQRLESLNTVSDNNSNKGQHQRRPVQKEQQEDEEVPPKATTTAGNDKKEKQSAPPPLSTSQLENQSLVDMDSDEARRIENYLKKHKQQADGKETQKENKDPSNPWIRYRPVEEERRERIIDVTSTATSPSVPVKAPPTATGKTNASPADSATRRGPEEKRNGRTWPKNKESRQFLSIDKDDFLRPYDAAVEMSVIDNGGGETPVKQQPALAEVSVAVSETTPFEEKEEVPIKSNAVTAAEKQTRNENVNGMLKEFVEDFNNAERETPALDPPQNKTTTTPIETSQQQKDPTFDATWAYKVLGVEPGVTMTEIKYAYSKKTAEFSPEQNPDDDGTAAENLRQLVEAFQALSGGYKKGNFEKEYKMLERLQRRRREQEKTTVRPETTPSNATTPSNVTATAIKLSDTLPAYLYEEMSLRTKSKRPTLLPVQESSYQAISSGADVVLNSPSGTGKTLGYILPLLAQLAPSKEEVDQGDSSANGANKRGRRRRRNSRKNRLLSEMKDMNDQSCKPSILVLAPSKDVAMDVGKIISQYHKESEKVATVFGGVPIKRQGNILKNGKLEIVVGVPGRILEYIKEDVLDVSGIKTVVIDEADDMFNSKEKHSVAAILRKFEGDYQKVLATKTLSNFVLDFCKANMKLDQSSDNAVALTKTEADKDVSSTEVAAAEAPMASPVVTLSPPVVSPVEEPKAPVNHWHTATRSSDRAMLSLDIIAALEPRPRVGIVFVDSKAEAESTARALAFSADVRVISIHEDMPKEERAEAIRTIGSTDVDASICNVVVTTDLGASNVKMPSADLVLQFGVPRKSTNGAQYDAEIYTDRINSARPPASDTTLDVEAILLYDYEDEGRLLPGLQTEMEGDNGVVMKPRALPSHQHMFETSYERAKAICSDFPHSASVVDCFKKQIKSEMANLGSDEREAELVHKLAAAMAVLSDQSRINGDSG